LFFVSSVLFGNPFTLRTGLGQFHAGTWRAYRNDCGRPSESGRWPRPKPPKRGGGGAGFPPDDSHFVLVERAFDVLQHLSIDVHYLSRDIGEPGGRLRDASGRGIVAPHE
jgi:hypothetical protein